MFAINILIPLIIGLFIYLTKAERSYVSDFLSVIRSLLPVIRYPYIIRNFACDFLWTYSLFFCLRLTLGERLKGKHNLTVILVTGAVAVILETIQLINTIPGTFDLLDILVELTAVIVAFFITTLIDRRFKNYEKD